MGTYTIGCTEGSSKGQADSARELANMSSFKHMQRGRNRTYFDFYETRRMATSLAYGCSYEESLISRFPLSAQATVRGYSEAKRVCVRHNTGMEYLVGPEHDCGNDEAVAGAYMSKSVDMQYKAMAAPGGVYAPKCTDGNAAGLADFKRVQALSARFRANQQPAGVKAQAKYDARAFAISNFRTCHYEEEVFHRFPSVAAAMRSPSSRY